jgi:hypothetical protein
MSQSVFSLSQANTLRGSRSCLPLDGLSITLAPLEEEGFAESHRMVARRKR